MTIVLHMITGFLGCADDWKEHALPGVCLHTVEIDNPTWWEPYSSLASWGKRFSCAVVARWGREVSHVLVGYSMGGRLALHAWEADPLLWKSLVFVSTHPGLESEKERAERIVRDQQWAQKCLHGCWEDFLCEWNQQTVFGGPRSAGIPERNREKRALFGEQLSSFSLGHQKNFRNKIEKIKCPMAWVAGERDVKFANLAKECAKRSPLAQVVLFSGCYHRVPWEKPKTWKNWFGEWYTKCAALTRR